MASQFWTKWQKSSRFHSWWQKIRSGLGWLWQKIRKSLVIIAIIAFLVGGLVWLILTEYRLTWTGFSTKTLWDWMQLLLVPIMLAIGGFWLNKIQKDRDERTTAQRAKTEQELALDKQREDLLQTYLDRMSELLLKEQLRSSAYDLAAAVRNAEVRNVARVRTITILFQLDARRIGYVFAFLREAGLMSTTSGSIVSLKEANLTEINFSQAVITEVDLRNTNLSKADLREADLSKADLREADLSKATLSFANLIEANLSFANLFQADLSFANLFQADLSGAYLREAYLGEADLSFANLFQANLSKANLREADLSKANLRKAYLSGANLSGANLSGAKAMEDDLIEENLLRSILGKAELNFADLNFSGADLSGAYLGEADLGEADLRFAIITEEQLKQAKSLKGATMPDGSKHP